MLGKHYQDNGWMVSVINGPHTYSDENSFEVGVFDPEGNLDYQHTGGDVAGWQKDHEVQAIIDKVSKL